MTDFLDERTDLSAADAMEAAATPPRPPARDTFMVLLSDETGPLDTFWTGGATTVAVLLGVARAMFLKRDLTTVLTAAWGPNPCGAFYGEAFIITIPGTHELPKPAPKRERKAKRHEEEHWDAGGVGPSYKERLFAHRAASTPAPVPVAEPGPKCSCGIGHTLGSYRALPLVSASDRAEGFTKIHAEAHVCTCGSVLHFETKRLVSE